MTLRSMNRSQIQVVEGDGLKPDPPTWSSHVLVPLTQNILGGIAVGGLGFIGFAATQTWRNVLWFADDALLWCALAGGAVTCVITVVRFFGDDLGIIAKAYSAGQHSRDGQVNALMLEIRTLRDANHAAQADGTASSATKREAEFMQRAYKDAQTLIKVRFAGDSIKRAAMAERGMGQQDWQRAIRLLKASGVMNNDGVIVVKTAKQALDALDGRIKADREHGDKFTPAWK